MALFLRLLQSEHAGPVMGSIGLADFPGIDPNGDRNQYLHE